LKLYPILKRIYHKDPKIQKARFHKIMKTALFIIVFCVK